MTGAIAKAIWERAAEPARREAPKVRASEVGAAFRFAGMVETLTQVRLALVERVVREEAGVLSEISSEYAGMEKLARKGAGAC